MRRESRIALAGVVVLLLAACAPQGVKTRTGETPPRQASREQTSSTPSSSVVSTRSTVPTPKLPKFKQGTWFEIDAAGRGKAVARVVAPPVDPSRKGRQSAVRFIVEQTTIDGMWADSMTFEGRLTDTTVVTTHEQLHMGSDKLVTVSKRIKDIVAENPDWTGLTPDARVSLTFQVKGTSPANVLTVTQLDPVLMSVRPPDPGPRYTLEDRPDPLVRNALIKLDGTSGSIVGYVVDFRSGTAQGETILEVIADKSGLLYMPVGMGMGLGRPSSAFGVTPVPRLEPESDWERDQRSRALASATRIVRAEHPAFTAADAVVYGYVVRVERLDGSTIDIVVDNNGSMSNPASDLKLQPWPLPQ